MCICVCICVNYIFARRLMRAMFLEWGQTSCFLSCGQTPSANVSCVVFIIKLILFQAGAPCNQFQWLFEVCKDACVTEHTDCLLKPTRNLISWYKNICSINNNLLKLITVIYSISESCKKKKQQQLQHSGRFPKTPFLLRRSKKLIIRWGWLTSNFSTILLEPNSVFSSLNLIYCC